jgi:SnoaL-like polyketide cyclase
MASRVVVVIVLLECLLPLWAQPVGARDAGAAFREVCAGPVVVNGIEMTITALADRARSLHQAFDQLQMHILDAVEAPGRVVIAFLMRARHAGPFISPSGTVAPAQRFIEARTIDVLAVTAGVVSAIWAVSDDLGLPAAPMGATVVKRA